MIGLRMVYPLHPLVAEDCLLLMPGGPHRLCISGCCIGYPYLSPSSYLLILRLNGFWWYSVKV